jgi:hypothetical protein
METIHLSEVEIALTWKRIKNLHLTVHPPAGAVRVSAPKAMMERYYPRWRSVRDQLNRLPIRRQEWEY